MRESGRRVTNRRAEQVANGLAVSVATFKAQKAEGYRTGRDNAPLSLIHCPKVPGEFTPRIDEVSGEGKCGK